jgi:biotin carboxylase
MNDIFAFVESNVTGSGGIFIRRAAELGMTPWLITQDPSRYRFLASSSRPLCHVEIADTADREAVLGVCRALRDQGVLRGVFSSSGFFAGTAAFIAYRLGLPGANADVMAHALMKPWQRSELAKAAPDLNPQSVLVTSPEQAVVAALDVGLPVVLKPTDGSGSTGVRRCSSAEGVAAHAAMLLRDHRDVLVEEEIIGPEFSVEIFHGRVYGITKKHLGPAPYFVETGHDFPAPLEDTTRASLADAAVRAVQALGLSWGPIHAELRLSLAGPKIIEVNARLAGDLIPVLIERAHGVDLIAASLCAALGRIPDLVPQRHRSAGIRFLMIPSEGTFRGVEGLDPDPPLEVELYRTLGEELVLHGDFRDRVGHVIAVADGPAALASLLLDCLSNVSVRVAQATVVTGM